MPGHGGPGPGFLPDLVGGRLLGDLDLHDRETAPGPADRRPLHRSDDRHLAIDWSLGQIHHQRPVDIPPREVEEEVGDALHAGLAQLPAEPIADTLHAFNRNRGEVGEVAAAHSDPMT